MPAPSSNSTPAPDPFVNLAEVIDGESIKGITKNPALMKKVTSKLPSIEGDQKENLEKTVKSAPFQYAIENFSMALKMGALGPALKDLNVNGAAVSAAEKGDVDSFMKAMQGGAAATPQKKGGGPSHEPGNSGGSQGGKSSPDMSSNKQNKEGADSKKDKSQLEKTNYREDKEQPGRKRPHGSFSYLFPGVVKVNSSQQTEPICVTLIDKVAGSELEITTTLTQLRLGNSDAGMTYDRGQNTDPVRVEKLGSIQTTGKCGEGSGTITSNLEQKSEPTDDQKLGDIQDTQETQNKRRKLSEFSEGETNIMNLSEAIKHQRVEKEKSQLREKTNNKVGNLKQTIKRTHQEMAKSNESFQESETKKIKIVHSSEPKTADKTITKLQDHDVTEGWENINVQLQGTNFNNEATIRQPIKRPIDAIKPDENALESEVESMRRNSKLPKPDISAAAENSEKTVHIDKLQTLKFEDNKRKDQKNLNPFQSLEFASNEPTPTDAIGAEVIKVEGEQQTEPVTVRPTVHSKAEAKITARKMTSRGSNQRDTQASTERSQNTDPVRIEEKHKRQHKPKDPKPPEI